MTALHHIVEQRVHGRLILAKPKQEETVELELGRRKSRENIESLPRSGIVTS